MVMISVSWSFLASRRLVEGIGTEPEPFMDPRLWLSKTNLIDNKVSKNKNNRYKWGNI